MLYYDGVHARAAYLKMHSGIQAGRNFLYLADPLILPVCGGRFLLRNEPLWFFSWCHSTLERF